jgi:tRNA(Ile)-lysidine synthase
MLAALEALGREGDFRLHCLHVEHGIRPAGESRGDAAAVRALCRDLGIPCRVSAVPPGRIAETAKARGLGIEGAARLFRHAAWNREAARLGAERVLVAHTRDDLLETLLMRVLRGSGPAGLAPLPRSRGRVLRPLLDLGRADVLEYLRQRGIPYRTDATNADTAFLRNRVRARLIPCLDEFFPSWRRSLAALGETQRLTADFLAGEAAARLPWQRLPPGPEGGAAWQVPGETFFAQAEIIREEALFRALDLLAAEGGAGRAPGAADPASPDGEPRRGPAEPRRRSLRLFTRRKIAALELGAARIQERGGMVILSPQKAPGGEAGFSLVIPGPGVYTLDGLRLELRGAGRPEEAGGEGFFAELPLVLRPPLPADYIEREGRRFRASKALDRRRSSGYTSIISAEDPRGIAAFIGLCREKAAVLQRREETRAGGTGSPLPFFIVSGGINVQRSE